MLIQEALLLLRFAAPLGIVSGVAGIFVSLSFFSVHFQFTEYERMNKEQAPYAATEIHQKENPDLPFITAVPGVGYSMGITKKKMAMTYFAEGILHGISALSTGILTFFICVILKGSVLVDISSYSIDIAGSSWTMFSGGQQQRVAIARAIVSKPALILADEPTGNLDTTTGSEVIGLLKKTSQKYGQTIVMVTHDMEIANQADRIITIRDGVVSG